MDILEAVRSRCGVVLTNLKITEALDIVLEWGVSKFNCYVQNAMLARAHGDPLVPLQVTCTVCRSALLEEVKAREDAQDLIVMLGSDAHRRMVPLRFDQGASKAAKELVVFWWCPDRLVFIRSSVEQWLNSEEHLLSALLLVGAGGKGKSKLAAMLATELTLGQGCSQFLFSKSLDPLGTLSHCGQVRRSGCVVLTDFEAAGSRTSGKMGPECLKSLLDVVEGGSLAFTRYRPTVFRPFLPRILAVQGDEAEYGRWLSENGQPALASVLGALQDEAAATQQMRAADPHTQAIARRMAVALVPDGVSLLTGETREALKADTRAMAAAALAKRRAAQL
jgi:hypothetical protein